MIASANPATFAEPRFGSRWLPWVLFVGIPVWWALGLTGFIGPIVAVAAFLALVTNGRTRAPRFFVLWLLFLMWVVVAATRVPDIARAFATGYRLAHYATAAILFLYVFNSSRDRLPARYVVQAMAAFFLVVVGGGVLGMVMPAASFRTPMAAIVPPALRSQSFVSDLVIAETSSGNAFEGLGIHRPKAPFGYTNQWGATYALTLPLAIGALGTIRSPRRRRLLLLAILFSIVPLVFSLDRGAWLSASAGMAYAVFRSLTSKRGRSRGVGLFFGLCVVVIAVMLSPLKDLFLVRVAHGYGDTDRAYLYSQAIGLASRSPVFGYGAPVEIPGLPSIGTHGHLWTVLVSFGFVGLMLFLGFLVSAAWATRRSVPGMTQQEERIRFWCHVSIVTLLLQLPYYEILPWGLPVMMISLAVAYREVVTARQAVRVPDRVRGIRTLPAAAG